MGVLFHMRAPIQRLAILLASNSIRLDTSAVRYIEMTCEAAFVQDEQQTSSDKQGRKRGGKGSSGNSIDALADSAVRKLGGIEPPLQLAGQTLQFVAQREMVHVTLCLFSGVDIM